MKGNRPKLVLGAFGTAVLVFVLALWLRPREPVYQGKTVSYWVEQLWADDSGPAQIAVREIGPNAAPFILAKVRRDNSRSQQLYRVIWPVLPAKLQQRFSRPKSKTHQGRQIAYGWLQSWQAAVPDLTIALRDRNSDVRAVAAHALGSMGEEASSAIPGLIRLLRDSDGMVREEAVGALVNMGSRRRQAVQGLVAALKLKNPQPEHGSMFGDEYMVFRPREAAAELLGNIGPVAHLAVPELTRMLSDSNALAQVQAAIALWRITGTTSIVDRLIAELGKTEDHARAQAFQLEKTDAYTAHKVLAALSEMGVLAQRAAPIIWSKINEPKGSLSFGAGRAEAARALWRVSHDPQTIPLLTALLDKPAAIPEEQHARRVVLEALGDMGSMAAPAIPAILNRLKDPMDGRAAIDVLGKIGPDAQGAVPELTRLLSGTDSYTRQQAALALWRITCDGNLVSWAVEELELAPHAFAYKRILDFLGEMGASAKPAIPAILKTLTDFAELPNPSAIDIPRAARETLVQIDPGASVEVDIPTP
jgi:HEAT repeat protein